MTSLPDLPELQVVATDSLVAHEEVEPGRVDPLVDALERDGVLRNPPIVMPLDGSTERYVILDGANRLTAFARLGVPHMLVQIVRPELHEVEVSSWNHVLLGGSLEPVLLALRRIAGTRWFEGDVSRQPGQPLMKVIDPADREYSLFGNHGALAERVRVINEGAATYLEDFQIERTVSRSARELAEVYPNLSGLVAFPNFSVHEVQEMAEQGTTFPAGLTRFIVSPRTLHVNFPLKELRGEGSLEAKRHSLQEWLRHRLKDRRVRFYEESTFLFDE